MAGKVNRCYIELVTPVGHSEKILNADGIIEQAEGPAVLSFINVEMAEIIDVWLFPVKFNILGDRVGKLQVVRRRRYQIS